MHAAKDDDVRVGLGGLARKTERVADEIRNVLDFSPLVVVRQDDGVLRASQRANLVLELFDLLLP